MIIVGTGQATVALKGSNVGVLFQNAEGNINMGAWFDDPDIEFEDIYWYNILGIEMQASLTQNEGLISIDQEYNTKSCYVELHRNEELNSFGYFQSNSETTVFNSPEATQLDLTVRIISLQ